MSSGAGHGLPRASGEGLSGEAEGIGGQTLNFKLKNKVFSFEEQKTNLIELLGTSMKAENGPERSDRAGTENGLRAQFPVDRGSPVETRNQLVACSKRSRGSSRGTRKTPGWCRPFARNSTL
jgi:hypothetical protein